MGRAGSPLSSALPKGEAVAARAASSRGVLPLGLRRAGALSLLGLLGAAACASGGGPGAGGGAAAPPVAVRQSVLLPGAAPVVSDETTLTYAGTRCQASGCTCRGPGEDDVVERSPPPEGSKRFELRLAAGPGRAAVDITGVGTLSAAGPGEVCAYVDLPSGGTHDVQLVAQEGGRGQGVAPVLKIAEYGPKGPFWYDVIAVRCLGGDDVKCDRSSAEAWGAEVRQTKRGRRDPCGSSVVKSVSWDTSGGQAERDGGLFRDISVRFSWEVKKFATQFPPGATECIPK